MFATRATYHTTLQATPPQLVFGRDAILNTKFEADWNFIRQRKQKLILTNNQRENMKRVEHEYHVNDKILIKNDELSKYGSNPWTGPYRIVNVYDNGTVRIKRGAVFETLNIRLIKPYCE